MEKFVKAKQYKTFGILIAALASVFIVLMLVMESGKKDTEKLGKHYKKEIITGVDGLTEKELWIEKSTNELDDLKKKNEELEKKLELSGKELEAVKKITVSLIHQAELGSRVGKTAVENTIGIENEDKSDNGSNVTLSDISVDKMGDFIEQNRNQSDFNKHSDTYSNTLGKINEKVLNGGIKTITCSNTDTEYDLDENFIFASTNASCVLMGSVTVSAGIGASSNPQPVLLRIIDAGDLPNHVKGFLEGAHVIGAAYGELSSESVVIRLERLVKIDKKHGIGIDIPVKGYVTSEYGNTRIKGTVYDRAGAIARNAAVAGFLSGMSSFMTSSRNSGVTFEPNSGLAQFSPQTGARLLEQGASKGIGDAVEKYADFIIKRAEQMQPVIMIDGGRKFEIVFTESVKASAVHMKRVRRKLYEKNKS